MPGKAPGLKEKVLGAVENFVQNLAPVKQIHQHVCGFHAYAHDMSRQACARWAVPSHLNSMQNGVALRLTRRCPNLLRESRPEISLH